MKEAALAMAVGVLIGGIFAALKLPIPAPPTLAGLLGLAGMLAGYLLVGRYFN